MYITANDLETHIYPEIIKEIVRENMALVDKAIKAAEGECKSYLNRYDLPKLFSEEIEDEHLKDIVKDVACWKLIKLANPNIDMTLFKTLYDDAIAWLTKVMKGQADPDGWPYKTDDPATSQNEGSFGVAWSSNRKRTNHF